MQQCPQANTLPFPVILTWQLPRTNIRMHRHTDIHAATRVLSQRSKNVAVNSTPKGYQRSHSVPLIQTQLLSAISDQIHLLDRQYPQSLISSTHITFHFVASAYYRCNYRPITQTRSLRPLNRRTLYVRSHCAFPARSFCLPQPNCRTCLNKPMRLLTPHPSVLLGLARSGGDWEFTKLFGAGRGKIIVPLGTVLKAWWKAHAVPCMALKDGPNGPELAPMSALLSSRRHKFVGIEYWSASRQGGGVASRIERGSSGSELLGGESDLGAAEV